MDPLASMHYLTLSPVESGAFITHNAEYIKINNAKIDEVAKMVLDAVEDKSIDKILDVTTNPLHPVGLTDEQMCNWIFLLDTINFSFWPDEGKQYEVTYKEKTQNGYLACAAACMKALDAGIPILDFEWILQTTHEDIHNILKSDNGDLIPMLAERTRAWQEMADHIIKNFKGQSINMLKMCNGSAQTLLRALCCIDSFRDMAVYKERKVSFHKRAQILIADVWAALYKTSPELVDFRDMDTLTMFADYRVPQVLQYLGVFEYHEDLVSVIRTKTDIPHEMAFEIEIRGCSIEAVTRINKEVQRLRAANHKGIDWSKEEYRKIRPIDIDIFFWIYRRENDDVIEKHLTHHRTRSIYY